MNRREAMAMARQASIRSRAQAKFDLKWKLGDVVARKGRFRFVIDANGCWNWTGTTVRGYGVFCRHLAGRFVKRQAHRVFYESFIGPICDGLEIHHVCKNRLCVNPWHLQPLTRQDHAALTDKSYHSHKTHCPQGHPYSDENTYLSPGTKPGLVRRVCRTCRNEKGRAAYQLKRAKA